MIIDIKKLKDRLSIELTDISYEDSLTSLSAACTGFYQEYTGRVYPSNLNNYFTFRNVESSDLIRLKQGPVSLINSVTIDGVVQDSSTYSLWENALEFTVPVSGKKIVVDAVIGSDTIEDTHENTIIMMVEFLFNHATKANYVTQSDNAPLKPVDMSFPRYIMDMIYEQQL